MIPTYKKIAILHPYADKKGGAINMMILLGNLLKERGNDVEFYTFSYDKDLFFNDIKLKVNVFNSLKIAYAIRKCDYIIVGNSPMQFVGVLSKLFFLSKAKIIWWHHHYPWYYEKNTNTFIFFKKYIEKFSIKFIYKLVANSIYIQNSLKQIYNLDAKLLYPLLDKYFLDYKPKIKTFQNFTIISYGRWVKGKNLKQIFQTYDVLKLKFPKLELLIGGVGEELNFFEKQYSLDDNVKFLGLLDKKNIVDNLEKSNVFLFPSKIDSFGLSALEALTIGIPIVGFSGKGLSEIVQNNKNGYLVNSEDEFTRQVDNILKDKDLNTKLSKNSIKTIEQFSYAKFIKNLEDIF